jgi:hypothetical protein
MKLRTVSLCLILIFVFCFSLNAAITLKTYKGLVQLKMRGQTTWQKPEIGMEIPRGTLISTGFHSNAAIQIENSLVEVKQLTQISVDDLAKTKQRIKSDLYLSFGKVKAKVTKLPTTKTEFKIRSAICTASVRGTEFDFGNNILKVIDGTVQLTSVHGFEALLQGNEQGQALYLGELVDDQFFKKLQSVVEVQPAGDTSTQPTPPAQQNTGILNITIEYED